MRTRLNGSEPGFWKACPEFWPTLAFRPHRGGRSLSSQHFIILDASAVGLLGTGHGPRGQHPRDSRATESKCVRSVCFLVGLSAWAVCHGAY